MMLRDLIARSGRSLRSARGRTILTALAIAVGAFALTLTMAASNGATAFVNKIITENFDPAELIVTADESLFGRGDTTKPREYDPSFGVMNNASGSSMQFKQLADDDIKKLEATAGVERVRTEVTVNLAYITRENQKKYIGTVQAINPFLKPNIIAGSHSQPQKGQIQLPEGYVSALGFASPEDAIGKRVILAVNKPITSNDSQQLSDITVARDGQSSNEAMIEQREFVIATVLKKADTAQPGTELYLFVNQADAMALHDLATIFTPNYRKYTNAYVKVTDGSDQAKLKAVQSSLKQLGYITQSVKETQEFLTNIIAILQGIVAAFGAIAIVASIFGIINTMYISVLQRTREIGLMKALGMRKRDIGQLFRFEAAWIGFIGGIIGSMTAIGLGTLLNPWITKQIQLGEGNSLLIFRPIEVIVLVLILMAVSILAGWLPSRKAAKLDPIEALRTE